MMVAFQESEWHQSKAMGCGCGYNLCYTVTSLSTRGIPLRPLLKRIENSPQQVA